MLVDGGDCESESDPTPSKVTCVPAVFATSSCSTSELRAEIEDGKCGNAIDSLRVESRVAFKRASSPLRLVIMAFIHTTA